MKLTCSLNVLRAQGGNDVFPNLVLPWLTSRLDLRVQFSESNACQMERFRNVFHIYDALLYKGSRSTLQWGQFPLVQAQGSSNTDSSDPRQDLSECWAFFGDATANFLSLLDGICATFTTGLEHW